VFLSRLFSLTAFLALEPSPYTLCPMRVWVILGRNRSAPCLPARQGYEYASGWGIQVTHAKTKAKVYSFRRLSIGALAAAAGATVLNILLFFVGRSLGAFPPTLLIQGEPFALLPVVMLSFFPPLLAAALFVLLARFVARPKRIFLVIALIVFVLMFFTPFSIPNVPTVTIVVLELMHVVVAAVAVWAVRQA
jgi:hypothetical protein